MSPYSSLIFFSIAAKSLEWKKKHKPTSNPWDYIYIPTFLLCKYKNKLCVYIYIKFNLQNMTALLEIHTFPKPYVTLIIWFSTQNWPL